MPDPDPTAELPPHRLGEPTDIEAVRAERDAAVAAVRRCEHELGELRGRLRRIELMLYRRTARRERMAQRWARLLALVPGGRGPR